MGWDTPFYLWRMRSPPNLGATDKVFGLGTYNFLYPTLGGWVSNVGLDLFSVENTLPLLLWMVGSLTILAIVRDQIRDAKASMIAIAAGSTWFGFFRLSSDLHANLLGLVIMLCGTLVFLRIQSEARPNQFVLKAFVLGVTVLLSSFAHVETALFLSAIWVLALFMGLWRNLVTLRRSAAILASICLGLVAGLTVFWFQQQWIASPLQGRLPTVPTMSLSSWLLYLAPAGILVLLVVPVLFLLRKLPISSRMVALTSSWFLLCLVIGLAQYLSPSITPFSERAVILMPTPFLAAIAIPRLGNLRLTSQHKGIFLISIIIIGGSSLYYVDIGHQFYNSFISNAAANSLQYLESSGVIDTKNSIFIVSDPPGEPGIAEHNTFWIGAYLGNHYTYLGRVDFLMAGLPTPFDNDQLVQVSRIFLEGLPIAQIQSMRIIYIADFNSLNPLPNFYLSFLKPLSTGVYEINQSEWNPSLILVPAYASVLSSAGNWFWTTESWARSGSSLTLNSTKPSQPAQVSVALAIPRNSNYTIALRVWDANRSNPTAIGLDGNYVGQIVYNGTYAPVNATVFTGPMSAGEHTLTISVGDQPNLPQYLSLDYVSVKESKS